VPVTFPLAAASSTIARFSSAPQARRRTYSSSRSTTSLQQYCRHQCRINLRKRGRNDGDEQGGRHRGDTFIRTIGIARATTKIGLANLVYNIKRLICLERRAAA
jgi:hypothetical protein